TIAKDPSFYASLRASVISNTQDLQVNLNTQNVETDAQSLEINIQNSEIL
ncbi:19499_t:CDS:1, partial [Dentiscutata erythropus]